MNELITQILQEEGSVAIVTRGKDGPHMVNTWNTYLILSKNTYLIPAGRMQQTEANLKEDNRVLMSFGSRAALGRSARPGAGVLITGTGVFEYEGANIDLVHERFPWARAALVITAEDTEQTL